MQKKYHGREEFDPFKPNQDLSQTGKFLKDISYEKQAF
jgi:hypothetical protein